MVTIIDPQNAGIAGNMILGAFIDLGVDKKKVQDVMEYYAAYFGEINVEIKKTRKSGINATYVDVECYDNESIQYKELLRRLNSIKHEDVTSEMLNRAIDVFKTIAKMSDACIEIDDTVTPYKIDKIIWLICSGRFYLDGVTVGRHKDDFINKAKEYLK